MYQAIGLPASLHNETDVATTKSIIYTNKFYLLKKNGLSCRKGSKTDLYSNNDAISGCN